ncbi:Ltp family lipoprotein [Macrococcus sp. S115]|uniref:Ltp family lipoprotein n=1 Tax=Macrococcus sp. S115 TaxID=3047480 RepID=UPI0024BCA9C5|nr:Ltp family lipoprotein [Macrococcus sp. S115]MDJ1112537.1 Ltp family lipoprotein [Macrococcus sp. S115]
MAKKKEEQIYYDANGNPVDIKKKRNPFLMGCLGLLALFLLLGACGAIFGSEDGGKETSSTEEATTEEKTEEKKTEEDATTEEVTTEKVTTEEATTEEKTEEVTTEKVTTEEATTEKKTEEEKISSTTSTREMKNALSAAENYVDLMPFSKAGLYQQLTSNAGDKYTAEEAQYAIDNLD